MKGKCWIVLSCCICLMFTACTATDPDNLFEIPSEDNHFSEVVQFSEEYQYGNMQKNLPSGNFMLLNNEVLFNYVHNSKALIYSYNLTTEEVQVYCKDATCKHETCVAGSIFGNLEVYNGRLYGVNNSSNQLIVARGTTTEVIASSVGSFFHNDDALYIKTLDSSLAVLEEGQSKPKTVIEEYTGIWNTIFEGYLYANTINSIIRVDLSAERPKEEVIVTNAGGMTDGQHIYYVDLETSQLYRCDMDGSNTELLTGQKVLLASINFDHEYFYYRLFTDQQLYGTAESCDIYRFPKEDPTQIEKIVTLPISAYQVFTVPGTGKLLVTTIAPDGKDRPIYIMGTDGSNQKILVIPEC